MIRLSQCRSNLKTYCLERFHFIWKFLLTFSSIYEIRKSIKVIFYSRGRSFERLWQLIKEANYIFTINFFITCFSYFRYLQNKFHRGIFIKLFVLDVKLEVESEKILRLRRHNVENETMTNSLSLYMSLLFKPTKLGNKKFYKMAAIQKYKSVLQ